MKTQVTLKRAVEAPGRDAKFEGKPYEVKTVYKVTGLVNTLEPEVGSTLTENDAKNLLSQREVRLGQMKVVIN